MRDKSVWVILLLQLSKVTEDRTVTVLDEGLNKDYLVCQEFLVEVIDHH